MGRSTNSGKFHGTGPFTTRILAGNPLRRGLWIGSGDNGTTAHLWIDNTVSDTDGILIPSVPPFINFDWTELDRTVEGEFWVGSSQPTILNLWWFETMLTASSEVFSGVNRHTHSNANIGGTGFPIIVRKSKAKGGDHIVIGGGRLFDFFRDHGHTRRRN